MKTSFISIVSLLIATTITAHAQHEERIDQAGLAKVAVEANDWDVRLAAVKKLTDYTVLHYTCRPFGRGAKHGYERR